MLAPAATLLDRLSQQPVADSGNVDGSAGFRTSARSM